MKKRLGEVKTNSGGNSFVEFEDHFGNKSILLASSAANRVWLKVNDASADASLHLNLEQVEGLISHLQNWVNSNCSNF